MDRLDVFRRFEDTIYFRAFFIRRHSLTLRRGLSFQPKLRRKTQKVGILQRGVNGLIVILR